MTRAFERAVSRMFQSAREPGVSRERKWFDRRVPDDDFPLLVRQELVVFIDRGFRVVREESHLVRLESQDVAVEAKLDPREGVELKAMRLGEEGLHQRWTYSGQVGRANVRRLIQIGRDRLQEAPLAVAGDQLFYEELTSRQAATSNAWTEFYARKGPQPRPGPLP
jgi:hypothetical protein